MTDTAASAPHSSPDHADHTAPEHVRLRFTPGSREAQTHTNLSAIRLDGRCLWVAGDETATIERLVERAADGDGAPGYGAQEYGDEVTFRLAEFVELPGPAAEEADIEGLARSGPYLWAVGSHSLKRKKVKDKHDGAKAFKRLATVEREPNREILVRLPVWIDEEGLPAPVQEIRVDDELLTAAVLGNAGDSLRDLLADDEHLGPFVPIPSKDNGLDIEGIAVSGERVYLGLRGPVLRGWAVLIELSPYVDPDEPARLRLREIDGDRVYRKHLLDLGGLGVRDLCPYGDDLLVLAGPTMDLDGPVRVFRWHGACTTSAPEVVRGDELTHELDLPYGAGCDHAEGIDVVDAGTSDERLLIVYDGPGPDRLAEDGSVLADVVPVHLG